MRRLFRVLFRVLTILSALFFPVIAALYVTSYFRGDLLMIFLSVKQHPGSTDDTSIILPITTYRVFSIRSARGTISFWLGTGGGPHTESLTSGTVMWKECDLSGWEDRPLFKVDWRWIGKDKDRQFIGGVIMSDAFPLAASAILPVIWLIRKRRQRRRERDTGHCAVCGYDLRATPHRCPECGAVPQTP